MAISYSKDERNMRFKTTQIGRYIIGATIILCCFGLLYFPPTKDVAPYLGLAGTLIGGIVMFYFNKSTSNEKMNQDAVSIEEETTTPSAKVLPFEGYAPDASCSEDYDEEEIGASVDDIVTINASNFDEILKSLKKEAEGPPDNLKWTPMLAALRFKVWLVNNVPIGSPDWKEGLEYAINLAQKAYKEVIGGPIPKTFAEMANYNKFTAALKKDLKNKYGCGKVDGETIRIPIMTLRELYNKYEQLG